jgi:sortase A
MTKMKWRSLSFVLIVVVALLWGTSLWIHAKAHLAQYLIQEAWRSTLDSGEAKKPWPWADTWPVAQLTFPNQNKSLFILAGSHGTSLAFGPGHIDGTSLPGQSGTIVFSGHRDTHFRFLKNVAIKQRIQMIDNAGNLTHYKVRELRIVDSSKQDWLIDQSKNELHLITCFPFDSANLNPSKRYIVIAERLENRMSLSPD